MPSRAKTKVVVLTPAMAEELAFELSGLRDAADNPDQYNEKIDALFAIADGRCRAVRARRPAAAQTKEPKP